MFAAASVKFSSVVPIEVFPLIPGSVVWERPAAVKGAPGRARRSAPLTARSVPRESEERGKTVTDQPGNNLTRTPRISRPVTTAAERDTLGKPPPSKSAPQIRPDFVGNPPRHAILHLGVT